MKIALITDTHFGGRGDSLPFDKFFRKFYEHVFFPKLDELGITRVIHLGDTFDRRKFINFNSLKNCRDYFFDPLLERDIQVDMIVGNHDTYFKNTNEVNSPDLLLTDYTNIVAHSRPKSIQVDNLSILIMPWICSENYQECLDSIDQTLSPVLFGHLELDGFIMHKGLQNEGGMDPDIFKKFDLVCSGHFHHRSSRGNITYLGNTYPLTWNDFDDPRGFHIFDTETLELEFIENPYQMFTKILYDDTKTDYDDVDAAQFAEQMIKLVIINKSDFYKFDKFLDRLYKHNPLELKIIEDFSEFEADAIGDENLDLEDTLSLLNGFVDSVSTDADKDRIKALLKDLYLEAQHGDNA
jgi:DNA repair exonuclease SbcCD nuclease subunit